MLVRSTRSTASALEEKVPSMPETPSAAWLGVRG